MTLFNPLNIVIFGLWSLSAVVDYCEFCYIWQLKEYRLDRMRDFFSTKQGQYYWLRYPLFFRSLLALLVFFWPMNQVPILKLIILGGFTIDLLYNISRLIRHQIRIPKPTLKVLILGVLSFGFEFFVALLEHDWNTVLLLVIGRFFILSGAVLLVNQITRWVKAWIFFQATKKIAHCPKLTVIGITGSYGKSAVKEYVSQILSSKFSVIKTPGNTNTDIGVAQFILKTNFSKADIFVVEMGAYEIGEIQKICDIVKPKIGILTAIIEQHLSLFGSLKNIQTAKYELLRSLPKNGLAITNADNTLCTEFLSELNCPSETFGEDLSAMPNYLILETQANKDGITWEGQYQNSRETIAAQVLGAHQAMNIAPAIIVARSLGLSMNEIKQAALKLHGGEHALSVYSYGTASIIDDSYNSNPRGFNAALNILSSFPSSSRRIVVTRGMLELAERSEELHARLGEEIAFCADELIVITPDFTDYFLAGIRPIKEKYHLDVKTMYDPVDLLAYIKVLRDQNVVVLLENRIPAVVQKELKGL